jgi:hypothetical protein
MEKIFETVLDMQQNQLKNTHTKDDQTGEDPIIKIGMRHPCLITRNNAVNITESVKIEPGHIEVVEMSVKGIAGYRYIFRKISSEETGLSIQMLIKNNPLFKLAFSIGIKSKMMKRIGNFFSNLKSHLQKQQAHEWTS